MNLPKALVIDDEDLIRQSAVRVLKKKYQVLEANNGLDGLNLWKSEKPDVVFLDILMPRMTGWQVLESLEIGDLQKTKVIVMSAFSGEEQQRNQWSPFVHAFLNKPFSSIFCLLDY